MSNLKEITHYDREGSFFNLKWEARPYIPPTWTPYISQAEAIDKLITEFDKKGNTSGLFYGPAGIGKSNIPLLLARKLMETCKKVSYVDTFNPTDPNDSFSTLYTRVNPSKDKPMIVVLEEVDIIIMELHQKEIKRHDNLNIQIKNKIDWNKWFDRFDRNMYQGVFLIMTSNKSIEWFNDMDMSYFRDGRVNIKQEIQAN
jgi:Cdc6-like AAA superfamily ATPase